MRQVYMILALLGVGISVLGETESKEGPDADNNVLTANDDAEATTLQTIGISDTKEMDQRMCSPYVYCDAVLFPNSIEILGRDVKCDQVADPLKKCCLPVTKHYVCYNIMADGQYLTYDVATDVSGTDFTSLCEAMLRTQNQTMGQYTSITRSLDGGTLRYRDQDWQEIEGGKHHIRDLACGVVET